MTFPVTTTRKTRLGHAVIAGGDDDIGPSDLIDWIHPVLMGLPGACWIAAEVEWQTESAVRGVYRCGNWLPQPLDEGCFADDDIRVLTAHLPGDSAAFILITERVPQILALLDSTARWLMAFDRQDEEYASLLPVLRRLWIAAGAGAMQNKKGPVAGALLKPAAE